MHCLATARKLGLFFGIFRYNYWGFHIIYTVFFGHLHKQVPFGKSIVVTAQSNQTEVFIYYCCYYCALTKSSVFYYYSDQVVYIILRGSVSSTGVKIDNQGALPLSARLVQVTTDGWQDRLEFVNLAQIPAQYSGRFYALMMSVTSVNLNFLEGCFHFYTNKTLKWPGVILSTGTEGLFSNVIFCVDCLNGIVLCKKRFLRLCVLFRWRPVCVSRVGFNALGRFVWRHDVLRLPCATQRSSEFRGWNVVTMASWRHERPIGDEMSHSPRWNCEWKSTAKLCQSILLGLCLVNNCCGNNSDTLKITLSVPHSPRFTRRIAQGAIPTGTGLKEVHLYCYSSNS
jgi:hypothetical protein